MKLKSKLILFMLLILPITVSAETEDGTIVAEKEKYYKTVTILSNSDVMMRANLGEVSSITTEVTKEEYDNFDPNENSNISTKGYVDSTIETNYKKLTTTIRNNGTYYYRYKAVLTWKNFPATRSYDIIGIGHYGSVKIADDVGFNQDYCMSNGNCYNGSPYYSKTGANGSGAVFYLPSGTLTSLKQTVQFDVEKTNESSTIIEQIAVGDYSHATSSISYANAKKFSVDTSGIYLESSILSYYDEINPATAEWTGTW